jgi:predicted nucleotidyltransferase
MADLTIAEQIRDRHAEILRIAARHGATQVRHAALVLELESLLGRKVDIASDGWVKPSIREPVYRDAIPV